MRIRHLKVERFRGLELAELVPGARNVLVGPNNAGKSTYLEALDLALHPGHGRPRRPPDELDYYARRVDGDGFSIEVTLGDLDRRFAAEVRDHLEGWDARAERIVVEVDGDDIEPVVRVRARGTEDFELFHEFAKDESQRVRFGPRLRREIGWLYDGRARDPAWQMSFYRGGVLDRLFADAELTRALGLVREAVSNGATGFASDSRVEEVLAEVGRDLHRLSLLATGLSPGFELGGVSERELLQMLRLSMPDRDGFSVPLGRQGRGVQRLLLVASLLRLARHDTERPPIGAFEEPEEALEPTRQAQMAQMIVRLTDEGGQAFVVTHSPDIVRAFGADDLIIVADQPRGEVKELRRALTDRSRRGYERCLDGPIARALFSRVPVLVEGPGDRAVMGVMWDYLAQSGDLDSRFAAGLEFVNCEGAGNQPALAQLLYEAGKPVVGWLELDRPDIVETMRDDGHCSVLVLYPADERFHKLEGVLAYSYSLNALGGAMAEIAAVRGAEWRRQHSTLYDGCPHPDLAPDQRSLLKAATSLPGMLAALPEPTARALVARALSSEASEAPFEVKNAHAARLFAESLVAAEGVSCAFRTPMLALNTWLQGRSSADDIVMPLS